MKICLFVWASQLLGTKKTLMQKVNNLIIPDPKHEMWATSSADQILSSLKKSSLDGIELIIPPVFSDDDFEKVDRIVEKHGLKVFSIHQSDDSAFGIGSTEIERLCSIANKFQAQAVTLHIDALRDKIFDSNFISKLKDLQKQNNIKFGIENMPKNPFNLSKSYTYKGNEFSSIVGKTGLSITLDTTHLGQVNEDICDFYLKKKDKIVDIHLSDFKKSWTNQLLLLANDTHLPLGKGALPIKKFLELLKKENYQGIITMEINADLKGLCESASLIRKILG